MTNEEKQKALHFISISVPSDFITLSSEETDEYFDIMRRLIKELTPECHDDVISREAALEINRWHHGEMPNEVNHKIWEELKALPCAYTKPKTGHWTRELIRNEKGECIGAKMICSRCGNDNKHDEYMKYCPNCGAKMVESEK